MTDGPITATVTLEFNDNFRSDEHEWVQTANGDGTLTLKMACEGEGCEVCARQAEETVDALEEWLCSMTIEDREHYENWEGPIPHARHEYWRLRKTQER